MFLSMYMFSQYVSNPEGLFSMGYMMHTLITAPPNQLQVTYEALKVKLILVIPGPGFLKDDKL